MLFLGTGSQRVAVGEDSPRVFGQIEAGEIGDRYKARFRRIVARSDLAAYRSAGEDDEHVVAFDSASVVTDDDLGPIDLAVDGDFDPGLLAYLAQGRLLQSLAELHPAAREAP